MSLKALMDAVASAGPLADAAEALLGGETVTAVEPARAPLLAASARLRRPIVAVTPGPRDAERLVRDLGAWGADAVMFPAWETLPHERMSPRPETVARRLAALARLRSDDPPDVAVVPVLAALQPLIPGVERIEPLAVAVGGRIDRDDLVAALARLEYRRADLVERRGEFAVRGGLVDVFPPTEEHPLRVELFGDEVTSIRSFAVASQRTIEAAGALVAWPCREMLVTDEVRGRAAAARRDHPALGSELGRLEEGIAFEGMEALAPLLFDEMPVLRELLGDATVVVVEPQRVRDRAAEIHTEVETLAAAAWAAAAEGGAMPARGLLADLDRAVGERPAGITSFRGAGPELPASIWERGRADAEAIAAEVRRLASQGARVVLCGETHGAAERIREILRDAGLAVGALDGAAEPGRVSVAVAPIEHGFVSEPLGVALVGQTDLFGKRRPHREPRAGRRRTPAMDLAPGDLVVHVTHGVGRYLGMQTRTIGDSVNDYLVLEYAEGDRLYVPADQLDAVSRYVGGEAPKLHRLGGADWGRQKARVRRAVRKMAGELAKLYAERGRAQGHAFSPDQPWQRELEDAFPYVETRDQLVAIDEVKADMESPKPMDRLICGDVGYGKTEIAIRAAFKAVVDGKQVAVLVPTTLLAQQHHATFRERFAPFPVRVGMLSRFISKREQMQVLDDVAAGRVDVIIGTHRLLQGDVRFADLGLLVVDEEQRFGVAHKEAIKKLRVNVDVLTMTATPIPRTLEMSLSGIRDLSVVDTPPEDRHPVLTYVGPFDEGSAIAAIRRELLREGQTFYVHNHVQDIERAAARIRTWVPEARVGVAHGQMDERRLERIMLDFWDKEFDVLVTTTIIESGLDIPTVNTLVVDRSDRLGLAQLYQLRGRVGRARERAYAYFFFPPERALTEASHQRLAAISQFTDLGSGLQIALRDLEIRGAGNLLGGEQHGHIATVGFDLYVRLLAEAVEEVRGRPAQPKPEVTVDLPVDAHLPASWIPREALRLEAYRRIAEASSAGELADARAELADRYGPLPQQAETLFTVAELRLLVGPRGARSVSVSGGRARIEPVILEPDELGRARALPGSMYKTQTATLILPAPSRRVAPDPARWLLDAMRDILAA